MKTLLGLVAAGTLLLGSTAQAQVTFQLGGYGMPGITIGQPVYGQQNGQYANPYGQANYSQPGYSNYGRSYAQPGYPQPNYGQNPYAQQGYAQPNYANPYNAQYAQPYAPQRYTSNYLAPATVYNPGYSNQVTTTYVTPYRPQPSYPGAGYSPYSQQPYGTGMMYGRGGMVPW